MPLSNFQRELAIEYLVDHTPDETLREVYELTINPEGTGWPTIEHFGLGLWVRNVLREGGFGWDDQTLDGVWAELIAEAARRMAGSVVNEVAER
jgi:hypothetical protein